MSKNSFSILFFVLSLILTFNGCTEPEVARFKVNKGTEFLLEQPITTALDEFGVTDWSTIQLYGKTEGRLTPVPFQIEDDQFVFNHSDKYSEYILKKRNTDAITSTLSIHERNGDLSLANENNPLVTYRYGMTYPPQGVDSIFRKSGYIHPVITPKGDTLSRIQPPDHYHHYGIWGPWTRTQINGQQVDFWNLGDRKGTVLFREFNKKVTGDVFAGFNAAQEHIAFLTAETPQVALNEDLDIKLWNLGRSDRYMFDYTSTFSSPLEEGILFEAYRYGGGIGMRFTERWHKDNCTVLTSEGNDRLTADGTQARWCIVKGESSDGKGTNGILFLSHPKNRMHPEPMRVWPIDGNAGRGDMFFEFCPIRHKAWHIEPNKDYQLAYRMIVFEGDLSVDEAEGYWQTFAHNPKLEILR